MINIFKSKSKEDLDLYKFTKQWIENMAHLNLANDIDETFTLVDLKTENYGYSSKVACPMGLSFSKLQDNKVMETLKDSFGCMILNDVPNKVKKRERKYMNIKFIYETEESIKFNVFKDLKPYEVCMPNGLDGKPIISSMLKYPHLLIQGGTNMGKSRLIDSIIINQLENFTDEKLNIYILQADKCDQIIYEPCKQIKGYADELEDMAIMIRYLDEYVTNMNKEFKLYVKNGICNNITEFNKLIDDGKIKDKSKLPYIYIYIDEYASLSPDKESDKNAKNTKTLIKDSIERLVRVGRWIGVYLILSTQRATIDNIPSMVKAMCMTKVSFKVSNKKSAEVSEIDESLSLELREFAVKTNKKHFGRTADLMQSDIYNFIKKHKVRNKTPFDFEKYRYLISADEKPKKKKTKKDKENINEGIGGRTLCPKE